MSRLSLITLRPGDWVDDLGAKLRLEVPGLLFRARDAYARACPRHFEIALNEESQRLLQESTSADSEKHAATLKASGFRIEGDEFIERSEIVLRLAQNTTRMEDGKMASFYRWLEKQEGVKATNLRGKRGFRGLKQI